MFLALALTWVHVQGRQRSVVIFECALHDAFLALALVDVEVFGAHIEVILVALSKVQTVGIDGLSVVAGSANRSLFRACGCQALGLLHHAEEAEVLRVDEDGGAPITHLAIVAD